MIKFIDLFAGTGGIRLGFEQACKKFNLKTECVFYIYQFRLLIFSIADS